EQLTRGRIDRHGGRTVEMLRVLVVADHARLADLHQELPVARELEDHAVPGPIAGDPHVVVIVDIDAVLVVRPRMPRPRPAPGGHEVALAVELEHRRRRLTAERARRIERGAALVLGEAPRPLDDPDVITPG